MVPWGESPPVAGDPVTGDVGGVVAGGWVVGVVVVVVVVVPVPEGSDAATSATSVSPSTTMPAAETVPGLPLWMAALTKNEFDGSTASRADVADSATPVPSKYS